MNLIVFFSGTTLDPNAETQAILTMSKFFTNIATINGLPNRKIEKYAKTYFLYMFFIFLHIVPLNTTDQCFVYRTYNLCQNGGYCVVVNNTATCQCSSFKTSQYVGQYCESLQQLSINSTTTKSSSLIINTVDDTVLVISIVLPFVAVMVLMSLVCIIFYYCYRRYTKFSIFKVE